MRSSPARQAQTRGRPREPKSASEQPGNSFKYLYWRLSEKEFQQLCAALLRHKYDAVRCFPVGMADEGIDAIAEGSTIYQVKWSSKLQQNPDSWLAAAIKGERAKILRLVREKRISRYILMTSVAGTTTASGSGSIQKLQAQLEKYSKELGVPIECWWQSDIDAEVDAAPDAIKWSYQEMLAGVEAMRYLIHGSQVEGQAARMRDTVLQVMATQWREVAKVKFSQVDLDRVSLIDLFVDVHLSLQEAPRNAFEQFSSVQNQKVHESWQDHQAAVRGLRPGGRSTPDMATGVQGQLSGATATAARVTTGPLRPVRTGPTAGRDTMGATAAQGLIECATRTPDGRQYSRRRWHRLARSSR